MLKGMTHLSSNAATAHMVCRRATATNYREEPIMKWLSVFALVLAACSGRSVAGELRAGAAAVIINPPEGTPMAGYYSLRGAKSVLDNLYSKALVLERNDVRVALVV